MFCWRIIYVSVCTDRRIFFFNVQISSAVCFLLSPAATYISGATLKVDAGQSLYHSMWEIPSMYIFFCCVHILFVLVYTIIFFVMCFMCQCVTFPVVLCVFVSRPQCMAWRSRGEEPGRSEGPARNKKQTLVPFFVMVWA